MEQREAARGQGDSIDIQLKKCPRCSVPIRRSLRYSTIINSTLADIEQVKRLVIGDAATNLTKRDAIRRKFRDLPTLFRESLAGYDDRLKDGELSSDEMNCIENVINFIEHFTKWRRALDGCIGTLGRGEEETRRSLKAARNDGQALEAWLRQSGRVRLSDQERR